MAVTDSFSIKTYVIRIIRMSYVLYVCYTCVVRTLYGFTCIST